MPMAAETIVSLIQAALPGAERLTPEQAASVVVAVVPTKFRRLRGNTRSAWYFLRERSKM